MIKVYLRSWIDIFKVVKIPITDWVKPARLRLAVILIPEPRIMLVSGVHAEEFISESTAESLRESVLESTPQQWMRKLDSFKAIAFQCAIDLGRVQSATVWVDGVGHCVGRCVPRYHRLLTPFSQTGTASVYIWAAVQRHAAWLYSPDTKALESKISTKRVSC